MQGLSCRKSDNVEGQRTRLLSAVSHNYFRRLVETFPQISHVLLGDLRFSVLLRRSVLEIIISAEIL
jgi:hypothetical protein